MISLQLLPSGGDIFAECPSLDTIWPAQYAIQAREATKDWENCDDVEGESSP